MTTDCEEPHALHPLPCAAQSAAASHRADDLPRDHDQARYENHAPEPGHDRTDRAQVLRRTSATCPRRPPRKPPGRTGSALFSSVVTSSSTTMVTTALRIGCPPMPRRNACPNPPSTSITAIGGARPAACRMIVTRPPRPPGGKEARGVHELAAGDRLRSAVLRSMLV